VSALEESITENSDNSTSSDSDDSLNSHFPIFMSKHTDDSPLCVQTSEVSPQPLLLIEASQPPHVQLSLLTSKFAKPLKVIGLIDAGAAKTIVNPELFPSDFWVQLKERFQAANGESFRATISRQ
jgi:hypothetical protein